MQRIGALVALEACWHLFTLGAEHSPPNETGNAKIPSGGWPTQARRVPGAPSFAQFAKGGNHERRRHEILRKGVAAVGTLINPRLLFTLSKLDSL